MANRAVLRQAIETDPALQAAAAAGSNSDLLALLAAPDVTLVRDRIMPRDAVLKAIGPALSSLVGDPLQRLRLLLSGDTFDFGNDEAVVELGAVVTDAAARTRLVALGTRPRTKAEVLGCGGDVTLEDLWVVLPQIATSQHARFLRHEFGAALVGYVFDAKGMREIATGLYVDRGTRRPLNPQP